MKKLVSIILLFLILIIVNYFYFNFSFLNLLLILIIILAITFRKTFLLSLYFIVFRLIIKHNDSTKLFGITAFVILFFITSYYFYVNYEYIELLVTGDDDIAKGFFTELLGVILEATIIYYLMVSYQEVKKIKLSEGMYRLMYDETNRIIQYFEESEDENIEIFITQFLDKLHDRLHLGNDNFIKRSSLYTSRVTDEVFIKYIQFVDARDELYLSSKNLIEEKLSLRMQIDNLKMIEKNLFILIDNTVYLDEIYKYGSEVSGIIFDTETDGIALDKESIQELISETILRISESK